MMHRRGEFRAFLIVDHSSPPGEPGRYHANTRAAPRLAVSMTSFVMTIEDAFDIQNRGVVVVGIVANDVVTDPGFKLSAGDLMTATFVDGTARKVTVRGCDVFRPPIGTPYNAPPIHRNVGILIDGISSGEEIPSGSTIRYNEP